MFNALKYTKKLEEVGLSREQAETHIQIMAEVMETNLATKQDMKDLQLATSQDFINMRSDFKDLQVATSQDMKNFRMAFSQDIKDLDTKINTVKTELENKMIQLEYRLTIKLGSIVSIAIGVAVTLAKII